MTFMTKTRVILLISLILSPASFASSRIISAGSSITEIFFALGAESQLVAADLTSKGLIQDTDIKQVGYHRQLSAEGLMSLAPDYLIGSQDMGPDTTLDLLKASKVEVLTVPTGNDVDSLFSRIDMIAELTQTAPAADTLKQRISQDIAELEQQSLASKPKVVFLMMRENRPATVAGTGTAVDHIIQLSGAINPAAETVNYYKPMSNEALLQLQPDYILVMKSSVEAQGGVEAILAKHPLLQATPAGQKLNIIPIEGSALSGGLGLSSIKLAATLQNEYQDAAQ